MENKQAFEGFVGGSWVDNNPRYDNQRTINYYTQASLTGSAKNRQISAFLQRPGLLPCPGVDQSVGQNLRCEYTLSIGTQAVVVIDNLVYVTSGANGALTQLEGQLDTSTGPVAISDNAGYVIIVDGTETYYTFAIGDTTLQNLTSPNYYGSFVVTYQDGTFLFVQPGTSVIFCSENSAPQGPGGGGPITFGPDNYGIKQGYSDNAVSVISNARELLVLGEQTGEWWYNSGASAVFPFQRQDGKNFQIGCVSAQTVVQLAGTILFLGQNPQGGAIVYSMDGYVPSRISTNYIENELLKAGDLSSASALAFQYEGHYFYALNVPQLNTTFVYDMAGVSSTAQQPGLWLEFQSTYESGSQGRWLPKHVCYLNGQHIFGGSNGSTSGIGMFTLDAATFTDNGRMLRRVRQSPHVSENMNNIFFKLLQVDFDVGKGLVNDGINPSNAVNPSATLECSNDGGLTWGPPIKAFLGKIGRYLQRVRWSRLGVARDRVFRVSVTDPVKADIVYAVLDSEVGNA